MQWCLICGNSTTNGATESGPSLASAFPLPVSSACPAFWSCRICGEAALRHAEDWSRQCLTTLKTPSNVLRRSHGKSANEGSQTSTQGRAPLPRECIKEQIVNQESVERTALLCLRGSVRRGARRS